MTDLLLTIETKSIELYRAEKDPYAVNLLYTLQNEIEVLTSLHDYLVERGLDESIKISTPKYLEIKELFRQKTEIENWLENNILFLINDDDDDLDEDDDDEYDSPEHLSKKYQLEEIEEELDQLINEVNL